MSYLVVIPFLVAGLLFIERHSIVRRVHSDITLGSLFVVLALGLFATTRMHRGLSPSDLHLSLNILALLVLCIAGFALFFGRNATRAACFPLLYLFLMVPPPSFILYRVIYLLQAGSADITGTLFDLLRDPGASSGIHFSFTPSQHSHRKRMQRHPIQHGAPDSCSARRALRIQASLEKNCFFALRNARDDREERNPHRHTDPAGDVRRPQLSFWQASPPRRNRLFFAGTASLSAHVSCAASWRIPIAPGRLNGRQQFAIKR